MKGKIFNAQTRGKNMDYEKLTYRLKQEAIIAIEFKGYNYSEIMKFVGVSATEDNWNKLGFIRDDYRKVYFDVAGIRHFVKFKESDFIVKVGDMFITVQQEAFNTLFE